jgi:hypothetical protein
MILELISPLKAGTYVMTVTLSDTAYPSNISASFANLTILILSQPSVQVNTGPPYFATPLISTVTVELNTIYEIVWPEIKDPDITDTKYTMSMTGLSSIASFGEVKSGNNGIILRPKRTDEVGSYKINI